MRGYTTKHKLSALASEKLTQSLRQWTWLWPPGPFGKATGRCELPELRQQARPRGQSRQGNRQAHWRGLGTRIAPPSGALGASLPSPGPGPGPASFSMFLGETEALQPLPGTRSRAWLSSPPCRPHRAAPEAGLFVPPGCTHPLQSLGLRPRAKGQRCSGCRGRWHSHQLEGGERALSNPKAPAAPPGLTTLQLTRCPSGPSSCQCGMTSGHWLA